MAETALTIPDPAHRADLATFVARVVQLDRSATVRLVRSAGATRRASPRGRPPRSRCWPPDRYPAGWSRTRSPCRRSALLTALAVVRADTVDPGGGALWRPELPTDTGWTAVGELSA